MGVSLILCLEKSVSISLRTAQVNIDALGKRGVFSMHYVWYMQWKFKEKFKKIL
jgi:hypothetical protein